MTFIPQTGTIVNWITALDLDFTAQGSQTLNTDTNYTISGLVWTKINSAQDSSPMLLTNGTGLIVTPTSSANIGSSTFNAPGIRIPVSSIIPNFTHSMPMRMWIHITADNAAAQFDGLYWGTFVAGSGIANQYTICGYKGFAGGINGWGSEIVLLNSTSTFTTPAIAPSTNRVGIMTYPAGIIGSVAPVTTSTTVTAGVWPAIQTHNLATSAGVTAASSAAIASAGSGTKALSDINFFIAGIRSGSGTAYTATVARFRVDYLPTLS